MFPLPLLLLLRPPNLITQALGRDWDWEQIDLLSHPHLDSH